MRHNNSPAPTQKHLVLGSWLRFIIVLASSTLSVHSFVVALPSKPSPLGSSGCLLRGNPPSTRSKPYSRLRKGIHTNDCKVVVDFRPCHQNSSSSPSSSRKMVRRRRPQRRPLIYASHRLSQLTSSTPPLSSSRSSTSSSVLCSLPTPTSWTSSALVSMVHRCPLQLLPIAPPHGPHVSLPRTRLVIASSRQRSHLLTHKILIASSLPFLRLLRHHYRLLARPDRRYLLLVHLCSLPTHWW